MARRIRAREVLRLRSVNGLSQNAIARTAHVSKHSVQDVLEAARERGVSWEDVEGMSEEAAYALLFPGRGDAGPVHADPDWARVLRELARTGVTPEGRAWSDWDAPRIRAWASRVGPSCSELVDRVFACYEFDEQGFNAALAVLRLSRRYTPARLERACGMALATGKRSPRYRDVEPVLRSGQDRAPAGEASGDCGYVRGAGFYGEE